MPKCVVASVIVHVDGVLAHQLGTEQHRGRLPSTTKSCQSIFNNRIFRSTLPLGQGVVSSEHLLAFLRASIVGSQSWLHRPVALRCSRDWPLSNFMRLMSFEIGSSRMSRSRSVFRTSFKKFEAASPERKMMVGHKLGVCLGLLTAHGQNCHILKIRFVHPSPINAKFRNWDEPVLEETKRQEALQPALRATCSQQPCSQQPCSQQPCNH